MSGRHVGLACALPAVALLIAVPPASLRTPTAPAEAYEASVDIAVSPLNLSKLALADFGDLEPSR